jgi:hypothetical protein
VDRILLNDSKGNFTASDLGPADRTYSVVLADLDGDRDLDIVTSNDRPDTKVIYLDTGLTAALNRPISKTVTGSRLVLRHHANGIRNSWLPWRG